MSVRVGLAGVALASSALLTAACGSEGSTVVTTPASAPPSGGGATSAAKGAPASAHVGDALTIAGMDKGSKATVTVVQVTDNATPADEFNTPPTGKRLYGVQFRIANVGTAAYDDSPSNGAKVVDVQGQSFEAAIASKITEGASFAAQTTIAPGDSGLGYIVFEVPADAQITKVQFALDSGFADQKAQWQVG
ncbi:hypothetical protein J2W56_004260 [Nocardia kruczakiae]|uniref:DUF4352 domain-containing protein n=2 Tax=Nocardia kruczakiae TaxID=261477 RepID=A0ABU1XJM2_9NOCA|nr:hypothetical protein [Nocardia kruczakiae]